MADEIELLLPEDSPEAGSASKWLATLAEMRKIGIHYDQEFKVQWLEERLAMTYGGIAWGHCITNINDQIISDGFCLTQDSANQCYRIGTWRECKEIGDALGAKAIRSTWRQMRLYRGILSNPTARADMSESECKSLEAREHKAAFRFQLWQLAASKESELHQAVNRIGRPPKRVPQAPSEPPSSPPAPPEDQPPAT